MSEDHSRRPTGAALRVAALEAILAGARARRSRGAGLAGGRVRKERRSAQRRARRRQGMDRSDAFESACSKTRPPPSRNSATEARRAAIWSRSRTPPESTTLSCARCAHAIRGRCWDFRRSGTRASPIARARCAIRAACSKEFGVRIPAEVEVRVWDSSAEQRYLVIPERPAGTEAMTEEQLAALVTPRLR